jgi:hypothetical protein
MLPCIVFNINCLLVRRLLRDSRHRLVSVQLVAWDVVDNALILVAGASGHQGQESQPLRTVLL